MVDAADLKSATSWRCVGSSPSLGTNLLSGLDSRLPRISAVVLASHRTSARHLVTDPHKPRRMSANGSMRLAVLQAIRRTMDMPGRLVDSEGPIRC